MKQQQHESDAADAKKKKRKKEKPDSDADAGKHELEFSGKRKKKKRLTEAESDDAEKYDTENSGKKGKKKKKKQPESDDPENYDTENSGKKKGKKKKKNQVQAELDRADPSEPEISEEERRKLKKQKKKQKKKARDKRRKDWKEKYRKIVVDLESTGRYPKSWLKKKKEMLYDLVLAIYWGPSWLNSALNWFVHGGWPQEPTENTKNEESRRTFKRKLEVDDFNITLYNDMKSYWPEVGKNFWRDEWQKHARHAGMTAEEYFSTVLDIYVAIREIGVKLGHDIVMPAKEALSLIEEGGLGKVQMKALNSKDMAEGHLCISELKIHIDKKKYGIVSRLVKSSFLGHIETGDDMVVLPKKCVTLQKAD